MQAYYHLASVAWLGGSFEPLGGQNLIEAAACGCPIVMGPHTFNFADAAEQAQQHGAAQSVSDMVNAWPVTKTWINDHLTHQEVCRAAAAWILGNKGAALKSVKILTS
jgi:3-deoxy-D-manno-octulosonic-acid transferase